MKWKPIQFLVLLSFGLIASAVIVIISAVTKPDPPVVYSRSQIRALCASIPIIADREFCTSKSPQDDRRLNEVVRSVFPIGSTNYSQIMDATQNLKSSLHSSACDPLDQDPSDPMSCPPPQFCKGTEYPEYQCLFSGADGTAHMFATFDMMTGKVLSVSVAMGDDS